MTSQPHICLNLSISPHGTYIAVKLLQPEKAPSPMLVTLLGIITEVKLLQLAKASSPMLVTLLGIVTEVKLLQL